MHTRSTTRRPSGEDSPRWPSGKRPWHPSCRVIGMTVAIVGYGRFGRALGELLEAAGIGYRALDPVADIPESHRARSLPELLTGAEQVVVAVPVARMRAVFEELSPHLRPEQLVLDVGSVKVKPVRVMTEVLGTRIPWVGTHPLFGPLSLAMAERPMRVVVCPN
ncbi:MAG: prephenate dehydrogenase/arogenate dehydrogenase family protein, partial [Archangium sp.]